MTLITPDLSERSDERIGAIAAEEADYLAIALTLTADTIPLRGRWLHLKRAIDIALSAILIALLWPIMAVIVVAIRLSGGGPALFRQPRVGLHGHTFTIWKFRTMTVAHKTAAIDELKLDDHKKPGDARITRIGRFLRATSLDELPQLFNVLSGDMSLIGPRPEVLWVFDWHYQPWQRKRVLVKPGITGWWQVTGRSDRPLHENTEDDIYYIANWSPWLDLKILGMTIGAVLRRRGAY